MLAISRKTNPTQEMEYLMNVADAKTIELVGIIDSLRKAGWTVEPPAAKRSRAVRTVAKKRVGRPPKDGRRKRGRPPKSAG